nr:hypothetical protein [Haliscomenobacter sp.]
LVHVKVNNIGIDVFLHKKKGHEAYLYFDSTKRVNLKEFNDACFSISIALGLITGAMYLDEGIYFQFSNKGMKEPIGFKYSKFRPTMKPFYTPIHTNPYAFGIAQNEAINWRERLQELEENGFSKLCEKIHNSGKLSSIILLSLESISGSLLLAPSGLSVVLEGLTEIFSSENEDKLNPIKSKTLAGKIKRDLLEVLEKHTEELSNEDKSAKNILKNKISNINSPTNKDKLLKPFEILDIPINDEDKNVINFRNDFLHGRITATEENDDENLEKENIRLYYITLRLYTLISALILKSIGYSGYILNLPKIHLKERKNLDEEYFRKI